MVGRAKKLWWLFLGEYHKAISNIVNKNETVFVGMSASSEKWSAEQKKAAGSQPKLSKQHKVKYTLSLAKHHSTSVKNTCFQRYRKMLKLLQNTSIAEQHL